jgi:uncharacterized membrane protein YbaN (DUF454 family)
MVRKTVSLVVGILLIIVGVIGLFLPILQGIVCVVAGLALVGYASPRAKLALEPHIKRCEAGMRKFADRLRRRIRRR